MMHRHRTIAAQAAKKVFLVVFVSLAVTACMSEQSTEDLQRQNMVMETALNAQIMSDNARRQRCDRDPSRRECPRR